MKYLKKFESISKVPKGLKNTVYNFSNYYNVEEVVKHFFRCSLYNSWERFNFKRAFESVQSQIESKLAEHGQMDYDSFAQYENDMNDYNLSDLGQFTIHSDYIDIDEDDILNAILEYKYEKFKETFGELDSYQNLIELNEKIDNLKDSDELGYKIQLFDSCIHAQHETGDIFEDFNPDNLRKEIDEEYEDLQ